MEDFAQGHIMIRAGINIKSNSIVTSDLQADSCQTIITQGYGQSSTYSQKAGHSQWVLPVFKA